MPDEHRRSLTDSLRRVLDRGKDAPSNPRGNQAAEPPRAEPPQAEPAAPPSELRALSLQELLRHAHVLAAASVDITELAQAQAEVDRRLVEAEQPADSASLNDALRRLERRRLLLEAEQEGDQGTDRLLRPRRRNRPPDDDGPGRMVACMCSILPPPDMEPQAPGR
jgi:hypothetical protein